MHHSRTTGHWTRIITRENAHLQLLFSYPLQMYSSPMAIGPTTAKVSGIGHKIKWHTCRASQNQIKIGETLTKSCLGNFRCPVPECQVVKVGRLPEKPKLHANKYWQDRKLQEITMKTILDKTIVWTYQDSIRQLA